MKKIRFVEIYDADNNKKNTRPAIKILRVFIRYFTRAVGYKISGNFFEYFLVVMRQMRNSQRFSYATYLLQINVYNIKYRMFLSKSDMHSVINVKNMWANYTFSCSKSKIARWNSKLYLSLMCRHGFYENVDTPCATVINPKLIRNVSNKKFYIYGPNASADPNIKYKDYTLITLKPIDTDLQHFSDKILFINSFYYSTMVAEDSVYRDSLKKDYSKVVVSTLLSDLDDAFDRAKFPIYDNISSPMALGRVLYNLIHSYGQFDCVIEGFDFYLDTKMYAEYYPSLARKKNIDERMICFSIADHDGLFNFLYIKELSSYISIIDSFEFKKILNDDGVKYLQKLRKVRRFEEISH